MHLTFTVTNYKWESRKTFLKKHRNQLLLRCFIYWNLCIDFVLARFSHFLAWSWKSMVIFTVTNYKWESRKTFLKKHRNQLLLRCFIYWNLCIDFVLARFSHFLAWSWKSMVIFTLLFLTMLLLVACHGDNILSSIFCQLFAQLLVKDFWYQNGYAQ